MTLDILDATGKTIRHYSSADTPPPIDPATAPVPLYWYRAPQKLSATAGMHRFTWDVHYQSLPITGGRGGLPIAAVPYDTVPLPTAPWAPPGQYTVKLTVDGKSYTQPLTLKMDPRVKTLPLGLAQQFTLSKQLYDGVIDAQNAIKDLRALRNRLEQLPAPPGTPPSGTTAARFDALEGQAGGGRGAAAAGSPTLNSIVGEMSQLIGLLQGADVAPTTQLVAAVSQRRAELAQLMARWAALRSEAQR